MSTELDRDLFGEPILPHKPTLGAVHHFSKRRPTQANGYAAAIGSGPAGETCGTCGNHRVNTMRSGKRFHKCGLTKQTSGPGSDIRVRSAACWRWIGDVKP